MQFTIYCAIIIKRQRNIVEARPDKAHKPTFPKGRLDILQEEILMKNVLITTRGGILADNEIQAYVDRGRELKPGQKLIGLDISLDGDYVDLEYKYDDRPFERIRRITGYLVGTLDRFNNAKRAEVLDRVTHEVSDDCEDVYVDAVS